MPFQNGKYFIFNRVHASFHLVAKNLFLNNITCIWQYLHNKYTDEIHNDRVKTRTSLAGSIIFYLTGRNLHFYMSSKIFRKCWSFKSSTLKHNFIHKLEEVTGHYSPNLIQQIISVGGSCKQYSEGSCFRRCIRHCILRNRLEQRYLWPFHGTSSGTANPSRRIKKYSTKTTFL